jgi:hypothetical protein
MHRRTLHMRCVALAIGLLAALPSFASSGGVGILFGMMVPFLAVWCSAWALFAVPGSWVPRLVAAVVAAPASILAALILGWGLEWVASSSDAWPTVVSVIIVACLPPFFLACYLNYSEPRRNGAP